MDISIHKNYANNCGQASNIPDSCSEILEFKLGHGFSPQANYADLVIAACQRS
jgi:hypothetical protein